MYTQNKKRENFVVLGTIKQIEEEQEGDESNVKSTDRRHTG